MIITLVILVVDWLVLMANDIPYLPWHSLYLAYLTISLRYRTQTPNYIFSAEKAQQLRRIRAERLPEVIVECHKCHNAKPPRYYHCRHCSRCIYRLDHHCEFVGVCIGQYNYKVYVHLLLNAFLHATVVSIIMGWNWTKMVELPSKEGLFWLTLLPGLFGMFQTGRLLSAFSVTVKRNQTLIESYKQVRGPKRTPLQCFEQYFGETKLNWLLPTFVHPTTCDLLEATTPLQQDSQIKQYTYADEYLYGADDDYELIDEQFDFFGDKSR